MNFSVKTIGACILVCAVASLAGTIDIKNGRAAKRMFRWDDFGGNFSCGLARVLAADRSGWIFIDRHGDEAFRASNFRRVYDYSDGYAVFQDEIGFGFLNDRGEIVARVNCDYLGRVMGGVAPYRKGALWGLVDCSGSIVLQPTYDHIGTVSDGLARVRKERKWGYVSRNGQIHIQIRYSDAGSFSCGVAAVKGDAAWGYIDRRGNWVIDEAFDDALPFSCGQALVFQNRKSLVIGLDGSIVMQDIDVRAVSECLAIVYDGKSGLLGSMSVFGDTIIEPEFEILHQYCDGLAAALSGGLWGFVDRTGVLVIERKFASVGDFSEGRALVVCMEAGGVNWGFIDQRGRWVWSARPLPGSAAAGIR